jgi:hypothetical protein
VESLSGNLGWITASRFAAAELLHVLAMIAAFAGTSRNPLRPELAAAGIGVERGERHAEESGGRLGGQKRIAVTHTLIPKSILTIY